MIRKPDYGCRSYLQRACSLHNSLTNPAAMLSDFEHGVRRRAARRVRRFMERHYHRYQYVESDNGRYWVP